MLGDSKVPANGRQTPFSGAIWVPSADKVNAGFGRRKAVISCALDSSIFSLSASSVGLFTSKRLRTCSQVKACCAPAFRPQAIRRNRAEWRQSVLWYSVIIPNQPDKQACRSKAVHCQGAYFEPGKCRRRLGGETNALAKGLAKE